MSLANTTGNRNSTSVMVRRPCFGLSVELFAMEHLPNIAMANDNIERRQMADNGPVNGKSGKALSRLNRKIAIIGRSSNITTRESNVVERPRR